MSCQTYKSENKFHLYETFWRFDRTFLLSKIEKEIIELYDKYAKFLAGKPDTIDILEKKMIILALSRKLFTHSLPLIIAEQCYEQLLNEARNNIRGYVLPDGRRLFVLAEGRLVNLASGDGHPAEIMDMSFAIQAMSALYLVEHRDSLTPDVIPVPEETDKAVAARKLHAMGLEFDVLSPEQKAYLGI